MVIFLILLNYHPKVGPKPIVYIISNLINKIRSFASLRDLHIFSLPFLIEFIAGKNEKDEDFEGS